MTDEENSEQEREPDPSHSSVGIPLKGGQEVVVTHLDSPPPAGKKSIHTRREAPKVPEHENRTSE